MPDGFISMHAWLNRDAHVCAVELESSSDVALEMNGAERDALLDLGSELRRFRAALLDALACAAEGAQAELLIRCGTIEARIDLDSHALRAVVA